MNSAYSELELKCGHKLKTIRWVPQRPYTRCCGTGPVVPPTGHPGNMALFIKPMGAVAVAGTHLCHMHM